MNDILTTMLAYYLNMHRKIINSSNSRLSEDVILRCMRMDFNEGDYKAFIRYINNMN